VSRREDLQIGEIAHDIMEEDASIPNYDAELKAIWEEVEVFI